MFSKWIDALEFENYGGWSEETQFSHEIGQGYLMAIDRPGICVDNCSTGFDINKKGIYRVWVRVRNWLPEHSPGRLRVLMDENRMARELGTLPAEGWKWDVAGDAELDAGHHTLGVEDTTGWFGRFAAIIITDDMDFTPSPEREMLLRQRAEMRGESYAPKDMGEFDVLVAGGGPGGVPAAIQAARLGCKVALIHSRPHLGGNSSNEATVGFDGAYAAHHGWRETGIAEEIRRIREQFKTSWEDALERLVANEPNITVFRNEFVIAAETDNNLIRSVTTINCRNSSRATYYPRFCVDSTGDGWLGYYSGAKYRVGREAVWQYGEKFAPQAPDNLTMSGCLMGSEKGEGQALGYFAVDAGHPVPFTAPEWAVKLPEKLYREPHRLTSGEWWVENPTDMDDLWDQESIRDQLLRLSLGYFHWVKNLYEKRDLAANLEIRRFPRYNAKRETRRLIGDYVLTQNDLSHENVFDDTVSYCGWPLDVHHPLGLFSGKEGPFYSNSTVPVTSVPYRCLYSKNIGNLFMASRCASFSHLALGSTRVENTLATLGQAAGAAAAMCVSMCETPRGIYERHMRELQQLLLKEDQSLIWFKNEDAADLARNARASATSFKSGELMNERLGVEGDWAPLDIPRDAEVCLATRPSFFKVKLKNDGAAAEISCKLICGAHEAPDVLDTASVCVPAGFEGELELPLDAKKVPEKGAWSVRLEKCTGVSWRKLDLTSFERRRYEPINRYHWAADFSNSYCLKFCPDEGVMADCSPAQVLNGYNRPLDAERYEWVSDPEKQLPQSLELEWQRPVELSELRLTFDSDLKHPAYSYLRLPIVRQLARDYDVEVFDGQNWVKIIEERDNILRRRVHKISAHNVSKLRVTVLKTYGDASARIIEVRAY